MLQSALKELRSKRWGENFDHKIILSPVNGHYNARTFTARVQVVVKFTQYSCSCAMTA